MYILSYSTEKYESNDTTCLKLTEEIKKLWQFKIKLYVHSEILINNNSKTASDILPKLIPYNHLDVLCNIGHTAVHPMYNNLIFRSTVFAPAPQCWVQNAIHEILYLDKILISTSYLIPHENTRQTIPRVSNPKKKLKRYGNLHSKLSYAF